MSIKNNKKTLLLTMLFSLLVLALVLSGCGTKATPNTATQNQPAPQTAQTPSATTPSSAPSPSTSAPSPTVPQPVSPTIPTPTAPAPKPAPAPAPAPAPQAPAVTASSRGQSLFNAQCVSCHGANGAGGSAPSLKGTPSKYSTQAALASYIQANMPLTNPHSLSSSQASDLAAYLFSIGK